MLWKEVMDDHDYLLWLRSRLINVYGESPNVDFVHRLDAIIDSCPRDTRAWRGESYVLTPTYNQPKPGNVS
jgi:hypothetical protein